MKLSIPWQLGLLALGALGLLAAAAGSDLGGHEFFMPHAHCYLFNPKLMLLHGGSDFFIGAAYVSISATLVYLVFKARRDIPFHWMMLAFALFIVACGATHFMEVWTLQAAQPRYWLSGNLKLLTAIASVTTAVFLPPLIPKVLALLQAVRLSSQRKEKLEAAYTELGSLYERVKELDALKTSFFANVSHELRTPLSLVLGPVDRLLESGGLDLQTSRELGGVRRNALILQKHVNDLLDISRLEAGKMQVHYARFDMAHLVRLMGSLFDSVVEERQISVQIRTPEALLIEADPEKLQRILINLLSNAFKFAPDKGEVVLVLSELDGKALIVVEDSGPGVPEAMRGAIFERFQQGDPSVQQRYGGTGLGLSIVKEFVELHAGSVRVTDLPEGAAFVVELPLKAPPGTLVAETPPEEVASSRVGAHRQQESETAWFRTQNQSRNGTPAEGVMLVPERLPVLEASGDGATGDGAALPRRPVVLVVEDNREMNALVARVLGSDYRIVSAYDGVEGFEAAHRDLPDLIISDVMMPRMGGGEFLRRLRADGAFACVPVIVLTAKADNELKTELLENGAQDYVMKPFAVAELRARVRNHLAAKLARDTLQSMLVSQDSDISRLALEVTQRAQQLIKARDAAEEASRAKDRFLAVLSHELRTPLTPVLVVAGELAELSEPDPELLRHSLGIIRRNVELEARLIDDLLDLTRISNGKLELHFGVVDAHEIVRNALQMCEADLRGKQLTIVEELFAQKPRVRADQPRLHQVFWNLILNAVKFTPARGRIVVRSSNSPEGALLVEVIDTGVGIAPEVMPRIFEAFQQGEQSVTRQFGGLGLGLAVARALMEAHGGIIEAFSAGRDLGTTMRVRMDSVDEALEAPEPLALVPVLPREGAAPARVLLVEDHTDTRHAMSRLLGRWGYVVEEAASIGEALEKARLFPFEILVSDLGLPDGHGTDLIEALRGNGPIVGVAISGFGMESDIARSREAGFAEHLTKPVVAHQLRATLNRLAAQSTGLKTEG